MQQWCIPRHGRAPVVTDPNGALRADIVEQADHVGSQFVDAVGVDCVRTRRAAIAALIGCQDVIAGLGENRNLVAPRVGEFGKAVDQDHDRCAAIAGLNHP